MSDPYKYFGYSLGTDITNFDKEDKHIFELAIKLHGDKDICLRK